MYGMINRGIEDFVVLSAGVDTWNQIKQHADIDIGEFLDSSMYDDETTYKLVASASEVLNISAEDVLRAFGRHWILYTGREGWATVFDLAGDNLVEFINGLDSMHARVQLALPEARMPHFSVIEKDEHMELTYRSPREGFAPMVLGLLEGLAEQFDESWEFEYQEPLSESGREIFHMHKTNNKMDSEPSEAA